MKKGKKKSNNNNELTQFSTKGILNLIGVLCTIITVILLLLAFTDTKYFMFAFVSLILSKTFFYFSDVSNS